MAHNFRLKELSRSVVIAVLSMSVPLFLSACHPSRPDNINDACAIYSEYPEWLLIGEKVKKRWGTPLSLQLAIIYTESRFKATARPGRGPLSVFHKSSALGYAQALNAVWRRYVHKTNQLAADRESFSDASDFIGWYTHNTKKRLGLPYSNAYRHYLAFHEGLGGYSSGSYLHKHHIMHIAKKTQERAKRYHRQLLACGML